MLAIGKFIYILIYKLQIYKGLLSKYVIINLEINLNVIIIAN